jgi:hypothetical protein
VCIPAGQLVLALVDAVLFPTVEGIRRAQPREGALRHGNEQKEFAIRPAADDVAGLYEIVKHQGFDARPSAATGPHLPNTTIGFTDYRISEEIRYARD